MGTHTALANSSEGVDGLGCIIIPEWPGGDLLRNIAVSNSFVPGLALVLPLSSLDNRSPMVVSRENRGSDMNAEALKAAEIVLACGIGKKLASLVLKPESDTQYLEAERPRHENTVQKRK
ncbi:hypothetical protein PG994_012035 [Apiospora phragmitis]|uniref:Uncharacterized protein n=1 Tax=Apiospora phragmitis TaxID=2905665 RepID=A0ABR1TUG7_9PEZI